MKNSIKQLLAFATIVSTAYMIWKGLGVLMGTESPIVVVLSESMSPAFERGDILFLRNNSSPIRSGDIVVFSVSGRDIPIVHRVLDVHESRTTGEISILTKGDNNSIHDRGLYAKGQLWLKNSDVSGRVIGCLPYLGMATIILNDYPVLKKVMLAGMALMTLMSKE
jgi:signal peptidase